MALTTGYNPEFIGKEFNVPIPELPSTEKKLLSRLKNKNSHFLDYKDYTVLQNSKRGFPVLTASNIDGKLFKKVTRDSLFGGDGDTWKKDSRIPASEQWGKELYSLQGSDFDKGHMTKREDVQWGKTKIEAAEKAKLTFFYPNAAPQVKQLNREIWKKLEDYILKTETVSNSLKINVFTGPVLADDDPEFIEEVKGRKIQIPVLFWKMVYYRNRNGILSSAAFLMGQRRLLEKSKFIKPSVKTLVSAADSFFRQFEQAATFQVETRLVSSMTGLKFPKAVDPFKDKRPVKLVLKETDLKGAIAGRISTSENPFSIRGIKL